MGNGESIDSGNKYYNKRLRDLLNRDRIYRTVLIREDIKEKKDVIGGNTTIYYLLNINYVP